MAEGRNPARAARGVTVQRAQQPRGLSIPIVQLCDRLVLPAVDHVPAAHASLRYAGQVVGERQRPAPPRTSRTQRTLKMRVRATVFSLSVIAILALASQDRPVAQQDTPGQPGAGQAPAGRGSGGGRGGGAARTQAEKDYTPPPRSPINATTPTTPPVTEAMLRPPPPSAWLVFL